MCNPGLDGATANLWGRPSLEPSCPSSRSGFLPLVSTQNPFPTNNPLAPRTHHTATSSRMPRICRVTGRTQRKEEEKSFNHAILGPARNKILQPSQQHSRVAVWSGQGAQAGEKSRGKRRDRYPPHQFLTLTKAGLRQSCSFRNAARAEICAMGPRAGAGGSACQSWIATRKADLGPRPYSNDSTAESTAATP